MEDEAPPPMIETAVDSPCSCGSSKRASACCSPATTAFQRALKWIGVIILAVHVIGVLAATIATWDAAETIISTGAILSIPGLAIAYVSFRENRPVGFYYGLAAPTATVICVSLIIGLHWDSNDARGPIRCLLGLFTLVPIPAGIVAVMELARSRPLKQAMPVQFGISSLLGVMLFVALFFSCFRMNSPSGMAIVVFVGYSIFLWRAVRSFRRKRTEFMDAPEGLLAKNDQVCGQGNQANTG